MNTKPDGGPAFPTRGIDTTVEGGPVDGEFASPGMSLRAWLAGKAIEACAEQILTSVAGRAVDIASGAKPMPEDDRTAAQIVAAFCCVVADAVLAELAKAEGE